MDRDMTFFGNVFQVKTQLDGEAAKVPIFYYDAAALTVIFAARSDVLRKFLPKREYHPLPLFPGLGAIAITCFLYRDTDIRPYNEISISIPISYKRRPCIPGLGLLRSMLTREFHVYIHHLPVTTEIALKGGVWVYNYPKFMSTIDFEIRESDVAVALREGEELIFRMTAPKIPAYQTGRLRYVTYPVKDNCAQHADVLVNARRFGEAILPKGIELEIGQSHPIGRELESAIVWRRSILYQYMPEFQSILYGPSRLE